MDIYWYVFKSLKSTAIQTKKKHLPQVFIPITPMPTESINPHIPWQKPVNFLERKKWKILLFSPRHHFTLVKSTWQKLQMLFTLLNIYLIMRFFLAPRSSFSAQDGKPLSSLPGQMVFHVLRREPWASWSFFAARFFQLKPPPPPDGHRSRGEVHFSAFSKESAFFRLL